VTPADPYAIVVIAADCQLGIGVFRLRILVVPFGCGFAIDTVYYLTRNKEAHQIRSHSTCVDWCQYLQLLTNKPKTTTNNVVVVVVVNVETLMLIIISVMIRFGSRLSFNKTV
jgi:hypothetical protein